MAKVKQELSKKNNAQKADYGDNVTSKLDGNTNFPDLNPPLTTLQSTTNNLRQSHADVDAAHKVYQEKVNIMNQHSATFDSIFGQLGSHIENVSNGDEAKIHSAGMETQSTKTPVGIPSKVLFLNATTGDNAGEIDITWDKVHGAKTYVVNTAVSGVTPLVWNHASIPVKSSGALFNLITGTAYQIRVAANGSAGQGPWSDPVVKVAP